MREISKAPHGTVASVDDIGQWETATLHLDTAHDPTQVPASFMQDAVNVTRASELLDSSQN